MLTSLYDFIGYTGSSDVVAVLCVVAILILMVCITYSFTDFIFSLINLFVGRNRR